MALQHLRSGTAHKRPIPTAMSAGQIAINTNEASPGLFFKDSNGDLVKVGPVHIGTTAPNANPATTAATALVAGTIYQILTVGTTDFTLVGAGNNNVGTVFTATGAGTGTGTVSGQQGVEKGEQWLDTTGGTYVLKIYDGTAWRSESGTFVDSAGDTMTGDLVMNNANIVFEGATADDFETTLTVTDPTADRTITLPNVTGTVVTTGDTGSVTSTMIADGTIVNADVNASAAIAGTKIDSDFGSQTIETTGVVNAGSGTAAAPSVSVGTTNNGLYSPGANQVAVSTAGTGRLFIDSSGKVGIGTTAPGAKFELSGSSSAAEIRLRSTDTTNATIRSYVNSLEAGKIAFTSGRELFIETAGSERLRINSSGNVGIGTSSPTSLLTVGSGGTANPAATAAIQDQTHSEYRLKFTSNNFNIDGRWLGLGFGYSDNYLKSAIIAECKDNNARTNLHFCTEGTLTSANAGLADSRMTITYDGNVGIGTTSPAYKLVVSNGGASGIEFGPAFSGTANLIQHYNRSGAAYVDAVNEAAQHRFHISGSEKVRIDSSGNVGIGTSSPSSLLHVSGTAGTPVIFERTGSNGVFFGLKDGSGSFSYIGNTNGVFSIQTPGSGYSDKLAITSAGKVGIGTSSPGGNLDVRGLSGTSIVKAVGADSNGNADVEIVSTGTTGNSRLYFSDTAAKSGSIIYSHADNSLAFTTSATERMRIDSSGRLLVGTTSASVFDSVTYPAFQVNRPSSNGLNASILVRETEASTSWPRLIINKNRQDNPMTADNKLGSIDFYGDTGSSDKLGARIEATAEGTWTTSSHPTRLVFAATASGASSPTERMRIHSGGKLTVPGVYNLTTTGGSAVYVEADGDLLRYTSSLKYKTDVETIEDARADAILNCRPVWYRSKCANDVKTEGSEKSDWGWYGFIAEEVAEIEPRLVSWATKDAVTQEDGSVQSVERDPADYEAEGVRYDNFVPLLVNLVKRQQQAIETLEAKVAALEAG